MRRTAVLVAVGAVLAVPASASADDLCVMPAPDCAGNPGNIYATVQQALDAAAASGTGNDLFLGDSTFYEANSPSGFHYSSSNRLEIVGRGATLANADTSAGAVTLSLNGTGADPAAPVQVHDLTVQVPIHVGGGSPPVGLRLVRSTAQRVTVVPDPDGPSDSDVGVDMSDDGVFDLGDVTVPTTTNRYTAIAANGTNTTVRGSTLTGAKGLVANDNNLTATGLRIRSGPNGGGLFVFATGARLADSTIFQQDDDFGVVASTDPGSGTGNDADVTLDHDTIVGASSGPQAAGIESESFTPAGSGHTATVTLRNSIVRGFDTSIERTPDPAGGTANVVTSHSDYDPATIADTPGVHGSITQGAGNVNVNPAFVNEPGHDFSLTAGSPVVDVGDPAGLLGGEPNTDILGNPRIVDGHGGCTPRSDMGAFELPPTTFVPDSPTAKAALVGTATAGQAASFDGSGSSITPAGRTLTYAWMFDDGGSAAGVAPAHTFASAGTHSATLTVTGTCGGTASNTVSFDVAAPSSAGGGDSSGGGGSSSGGGGSTTPTVPLVPGPVPETKAPVVSGLRAAPSRVKPGGKLTLQFTLDEAASVRVAVVGKVKTRKKGKVRTTTKTFRTVAANGAAGANSVTIATRGLKPGSYQLQVTATDAAGNTGRTSSRFTVLRPRR